jgi:hypothetical protein
MGPDKPGTPWADYPCVTPEMTPSHPSHERQETDEERYQREAEQEVEEILSDDYPFNE